MSFHPRPPVFAMTLVAATVAATAAAAASGAGASPQATAAAPASGGRFVCYQAQLDAFARAPRTLVDQFGGRSVLTLTAPELVCAPSLTVRAGGYLVCYRVRVSESQLRPQARALNDELTTRPFRLTPTRLESLCLPAARLDVGPAASTAGSDAYACYATRTQRAATALRVDDVFARTSERLRTPIRLCAPATKPGVRPVAATALLACYTVDSGSRGSTVILRNELGFLKATLGPRLAVCTAATPAASAS